MEFYNKSIEEIYKELNSGEDGLKDEQVNEYLKNNGYNKFDEAKKESSFIKFLNQFKDLMIIILLAVAVFLTIYGIIYSHDFTDPIIIYAVVFINAIMGFIQEKKAEVTLESLKKYNISTITVRRNDKVQVLDSTLLVPGDIVYLEAGNIVPADIRIIESSFLAVDEASLTGESVPVKKNNEILKGKCLIQDRYNMLFSGTNITSGRVTGIVIYTGMHTELGSIASSLNTPYKVVTPLEKKISELTRNLSTLIFIILIFIFVYSVLVLKSSVLEIIFLCVSLAVAAIPEGLPAVITITLSVGAGTLAKKKAIVKQIKAIETLGATDIICTDKTGTITMNQMTVKETIAYDDEMLKYVALLCNDTKIEKKELIGDPTETCLIEYYSKKVDIYDIISQCKRIIDYPFDSNRKMMSTINEINDKYYMLVKGSIDSLIKCCKYIIKDGKKIKINGDERDEILANEKKLSSKALRVMGFAYKEISNESINDIEENECDLIFVGLIGMIDPPRKEVFKAVETCKKAGIMPIMLTGDSYNTACEIARNVGILNEGQIGVLGSDIDKLSDKELDDFIKNVVVYARVSPEHKRRIVAAWQRCGKVVGMTGDGVNDAPAIKDAHVGIGMGITGTEVTKSVADIIILDDSFATIVDAVEEGRNIYNNIRNNVVYSLSSNFAEIFTILIGMFAKVTMLLPIHILFIDLLTDSIPSICLSYERNYDQMNEKPRGLTKPLFTKFVNAHIIFSAILETFYVVTVFFVLNKSFDSSIAMTGTLLSMVMQEIIYSFVCRNLKKSILKYGPFSNKVFNIGILILLIIETIFFITPAGKILSITTLRPMVALCVILFNLTAFILYELAKLVINKLFKD